MKIFHSTRRGIMVAGCPRSGSTIIAKVLALASEAGYVEEPFNSQTGMVGTDDRFFPHIYPRSKYQFRYDQLLNDILDGRAHYKENSLQPPTHNPLRMLYRLVFTNRYHIRYRLDTLKPRVTTYILKDPTATLSAEHFMCNPRLRVLYTLRHPCGVVASHQRLGWGSPVQELLADRQLNRQLSPAAQKVKGRKLSEVEALAWYWRVVNEMVLESARKHPEVMVAQHESFSKSPQTVVKKIYQAYGLEFNATIAEKLAQLTNSSNPVDPTNNDIHVLKRNSRANLDRWQKLLSERDQKIIMKICGPTYRQILDLPNIV